MYDINTKNLKKGIFEHFTFLVFGIIFIALIFGDTAIQFIKHLSMDSKAIGARAELPNEGNIKEGKDFNALFYYKVNGHEYFCYKKETYSSAKYYDSNAIIEYDSKNPSKCMVEYEKISIADIIVLLIISSIPLTLIVVSVINMIKLRNRVRIVKILNQNGKLIKNLPYKLERTGIKIYGKRMHKPVINYSLPDGKVLELEGDLRYDNKLSGDDEFVDLVIDESNPQNYFIDFEINRLTGNLQGDYYKGNVNNITNTDQSTVQNNDTIVNNVPNINNSNNQNVMNQSSINQNIVNNTQDSNNQNNVIQ